ncbi:hypothetical protein OG900_33650 [Streptomyces sp. NBC_00433]
MSLITFRAPGHGRRQASPNARLAAENQRLRDEVRNLRHQLEGAGILINGLRVQLNDADEERQAEVRAVARVLGDGVHALNLERHAHQVTRGRLDAAVRANTCNTEAATVQTDVTVLRAAMADRFVEEPAPGPEYGPHRRVASRTIRVMPLWDSPQAAHPAAFNLAGAR